MTRKKTSDNIQSSREKTQDTIWKHMTERVDKVECDKARAESKSEKEIIEGRIGEKSTENEQNINFEVTPVKSLKKCDRRNENDKF